MVVLPQARGPIIRTALTAGRAANGCRWVLRTVSVAHLTLMDFDLTLKPASVESVYLTMT